MAPLLALVVNALIPVAVTEIKKKIAADDPARYEDHTEVPTSVAAPIAAKAVAVGTLRSKTGWFALGLLVLGFLEQNQQLLGQLIPAQYMGVVLSGIGFLTLLLRTLTTQSVVEKAAPKSE